MKCLIDTNILVSASLFPNSTPFAAFIKASLYPNTSVICDYSIEELRRVYRRKFLHKMAALEHFLSSFLSITEIIPTPSEYVGYIDEKLIRDAADRPILRAAIASYADILITGDKDFLESAVKKPKILTAAQFMNLK